MPLAWSVALEKLASTPDGAVPSVGVQLVAPPDFTTTMRRSPLPLVQFTTIDAAPTEVNDPTDPFDVGAAATNVCAPPAEAEPDNVPAANVSAELAMALMLTVWPKSAAAAMSAVMKKYPVLPELIAWLNPVNDFAPAAAGPVIVLMLESLPVFKVASAEYHSFKFVRSFASYVPAVVNATVFSSALATVTAALNLTSTCATVPVATVVAPTVPLSAIAIVGVDAGASDTSTRSTSQRLPDESSIFTYLAAALFTATLYWE